jgi:hypothetical protein
MKLPEEIRQILTQHTVDIGSDGGGVIPDYELDDITAEVLEVLKVRGNYYPQSRVLGSGWWVFISENEVTDESDSN